MMEFRDNELLSFEATGVPVLPVADASGFVENKGSRIWYSVYGDGAPLILLHGGLGHSGNWGHQVPALIEGGYRVVLIDSRGHGRSTRDHQPYSYELMASDVLAVMNLLNLEKAALIGWSDGACTAMVLGAMHPARVSGVFFFACNMDPSGLKPFRPTPVLNRCFARHKADYEELSATPGQFERFVEDVGLMQRTQPNYSTEDLATIKVPIMIAQSEKDEFITKEHAEHLARTIPGASFLLLEEVSHFAPWQQPARFNAAVLAFLTQIAAKVESTTSRTTALRRENAD
jgi:pimeloyl-ACP methyl ester carboxylesterase